MAKTVDQYFDDLRGTRVWRSIFRSGTGSSTLKRDILAHFAQGIATDFLTTLYLATTAPVVVAPAMNAFPPLPPQLSPGGSPR